jgi:hypothetical protein
MFIQAAVRRPRRRQSAQIDCATSTSCRPGSLGHSSLGKGICVSQVAPMFAQRAMIVLIWRGVFPVQRLHACVNALTS